MLILFPAFPPLFPAFSPLFPVFPHHSLHFWHSHADSPHSNPYAPHFHPDSPHSPHAVPQFPILAFADGQKQAFKCLFKILWRKIDNTTFYFLIFLVKVWNENSISIPIYPGIIYFWIWLLFGGATYQGGEETEGGSGALMSNLCLISHLWYDVEKLTLPGSSNLNLSFSGPQQKLMCKNMKEKCVIFCFLKLNAKIYPKSSMKVWLFCTEVRSLLSKLIFTQFVSCWNRSH